MAVIAKRIIRQICHKHLAIRERDYMCTMKKICDNLITITGSIYESRF